jgi:hypothetical protein
MQAFRLQRAPSARRKAEQLDRSPAGRPQGVIDLGVPHAELGIDQGASGERQPDLVLGTTFVVQRQQLGEQLLNRAPRIVGELERTDSLPDPLRGQLDREVEQLRLGAEVVAERPGRPSRFLRDRSDRGALDAVSADHAPDGLRDLAAPLLVVDDFGHCSSFLAHPCYIVPIRVCYLRRRSWNEVPNFALEAATMLGRDAHDAGDLGSWWRSSVGRCCSRWVPSGSRTRSTAPTSTSVSEQRVAAPR